MDVFEVKKDILRVLYPRRASWCHKGDFGKVLIIGGSEKFTGAPALSAMAALRSGADLAVIAAPERAANIDASLSPNIITVPLHGSHLTESHMAKIYDSMAKADSILIGPGLGEEKETIGAVLSIIKEIKKPCVIDADAIKAIKGQSLGKNFVLTPHEGEYASLAGEKPDMEPEKRISEVQSLARKMNCVIILKSHVDIISDGEKAAVNETGNPFMTKGGTGDVLAGIVAALLGRRISPFDSACGGAFICGAAGDIAAQRAGESLLATDVIDAIPSVINLKK